MIGLARARACGIQMLIHRLATKTHEKRNIRFRCLAARASGRIPERPTHGGAPNRPPMPPGRRLPLLAAALSIAAGLVLLPTDAMALGRLLTNLGGIDSKERLWLAAFAMLAACRSSAGDTNASRPMSGVPRSRMRCSTSPAFVSTRGMPNRTPSPVPPTWPLRTPSCQSKLRPGASR